MESCREKDAFQAAKEAEARILRLQAEVQHLKQRIQLSESEEKAEAEENLKKMKDNKHRIKKLQAQIDDLQIRLNKGLKGDERIITKAFKKHSREMGVLARKSGREAVDFLDGKVLDLIKQSNALTHELQRKETQLKKLKEKAKTMQDKILESNLPETETAVRIRELENEYMKVEKNLMECQVIQVKYKAIEDILRKELAAYPNLLDDLEDEYSQQRVDVERLSASEVLARDRRDKARALLAKAESGATKARIEKERIIGEFGKALKPRHIVKELSERQSMELGDSDEAEEWRHLRAEQENELRKMKEAFEKIKAAIGISDIEEAESRFLSQRKSVEELTDLVAQAEEKRHDLLEELEELRSKKESLKGAELARPQVVLEEELRGAQGAQEEQSQRKAEAEVEMERIQKLSAEVKSSLWHQLQLVEKYATEDSVASVSPDESLSDISSLMEAVVKTLFEKLKDHDLNELKSNLMEEQMLQKMDTIKTVPAPSRKVKQADEEESSDDEDLEKKRNQLKKEAEIYAEMKKKQQGRGRMMML